MSFGMVAAGLGAAASVKSLTSGGGGGGGSTSSKEPWGPVAPWLENNVQKGEALQGAYEQQPFNALQQTAYQNAFGDIDNFRGNLMPSMMQMAGGLMGSNFRLPQSYSAAAMQGGGGGGSGGGGSPGLMTVGPPPGQGQAPQPAARPPAMFGNIDWQSLSPYTNGAIPAAPAAPSAPEQDEARRAREQEEAYQRYWEGELRGAGA